ncbi:5-methyltetrahydropteroyltriglutamate--homocysteine S-methyltransferase [Vibrio furnissii]|uniref:5-methyltetrahydropteroyltriglutamate-- homocysteine S-methyltransferase n=1 Tax=Vibrio furnissii TaxID=29494 RepID=UPI001E40E2B4|nr:5-methyltetrahydropteroyltriglutamate--homocysteine S-methyltransferase [Vibrio furnissii]MCG6270367.1 5-methyltetrahydropteroyltriglutamate--homocysteine S-methyltransferase [Vibrio furnissii]UHJ58976.1 5-methyltetrahydropteroyltriglutamate--homocysteine S-methyltransferase [Vibrio furnissii]
MTSRPPFRTDTVGSYLRPAFLHQARRDFAQGKIDRTQLTQIEDRAILDLVEQQKAAGIQAITDGEFRRGFWHIDFLENLHGIEGYTPDAGYNQTFHGKAAPAYNIRATSRIAFNPEHPFLAHFDFLLKAVGDDEGNLAKATIPSPTMILRQEILANDGSSRIHDIYPDLALFYQDLAQTYRDAIQAFYTHGCRYLQFDDTNWAFLIDADKRKSLEAKGINPDEIAQICTRIINDALRDKPNDLIVTTHICRGNHASSWLFSGGYEPVAEALFATHYDGFFLEYDSERSGDFAPLRHWSNTNSQIVLGLITSKFPELEQAEQIKARIHEATRYVPLENLCISPQCGFASTEEGNKLTAEEQWAKIRFLKEIEHQVWAL